MGFKESRLLLSVIAGSLIFILIVIGLYIVISGQPPTTTPDTVSPTVNASQNDRLGGIIGPKNGSYLNTSGGEESRLYLIDSDIRYGTFDRDVVWPPEGFLAKKGEPCTIINGTIRNDYDTDYYVGLVAYIYNESGGQVGRVVNAGMGDPWFRFMTLHVKSNETEPFQIYINYDQTDVVKYEIFTSFTSEIPPP